jgi:DNA repair protein RadC
MDNDETKKSATKTPHEFKVMRVRECAFPAQMIDTPERAVEYWRQNIINADWYDESKEALVVLVLNTRRRIIGHNLVTLGNLDSCFVSPREIFRPVIVAAGSACILVHNHPSGDPTPSEADIKVTRDLIRAGQLLKIELLDHVIVGRPGSEQTKPYSSLRESGYFT